MNIIKDHSGLFTSNKKDWTTPKDLFNELNNKYNFTLDVCADDNNHLCDKYFTKENSCLKNTWFGETCFMNPPYGREIGKFIEAAFYHYVNGTKIVMLLPARTDTIWFHKYIYNKPYIRIEFLKGRLKFGNSKQNAPFPSMIVKMNLV